MSDTERIKAEIENMTGIPFEDVFSWRDNHYDIATEVSQKFTGYIKKADKIAILGDYDCDGIMASCIALKSIEDIFNGEKDVTVKIPKRREGYGLNKRIIDECIDEGIDLVITVDTGITAKQLIQQLKDAGIKVLLTDHHEFPDKLNLPKANMVINPSVSYIHNPLSGGEYCGAGVIYKLFEPQLSVDATRYCKCLAGIASIADVITMKEATWQLTNQALTLIRAGYAPEAINMLLKGLKQEPKYTYEDTIGFYLAPAINAPGRLMDNGADIVLDFILNPTKEKVNQLVEINNTRRTIRDSETALVKANIELEGLQYDEPIVVYTPALHSGIVGLIAGGLAEEYKTSVIILTDTLDGNISGSCRSYGDFNIYEFLKKNEEHLLKFGGHEKAAGLTTTMTGLAKIKENVGTIRQHDIDDLDDSKSIYIEQSDIKDTCKLLAKIRPFGEGFTEPDFRTEIDLTHSAYTFMGANKNHLSITDGNIKFPGYKIVHFNHLPNTLHNQNNFIAIGKIHSAYFAGKTYPEFGVDVVKDIDKDNDYDNLEQAIG